MPGRSPTTAELEASRDARVAQRNLERAEEYLDHLNRARKLRTDSGLDEDDRLEGLIKQGRNVRGGLARQAGHRVFQRRRPQRKDKTGVASCTIFLDECGSHNLGSADTFPVFVLAAVIVPDDSLTRLDRRWKRWKNRVLGSAKTIVHEPDIRYGEGSFGGNDRHTVVAQLGRELGALDFMAVACVIHRPDYFKFYGKKRPDPSLPDHLYMMSLDFLFERVALALDTCFDGARARVVAESRGAKEDALLQYEFGRLHLDGTTYIASGWFRHQFQVGIDFRGKDANSTGLQLADLIARPCGEKVVDPAKTPDRWLEVREKLCPGLQTKNSILGLKIFPWHERFKDVWKS